MLGDNIQKIRKSQGMTQERLASILGVNRATLSKYESGIIEPPPTILEQIARILQVPISYLFGEGWGQVLAFDLQEKILSSIEDNIMTELSAANPADNYEVFGIADNEAILESIIDRHATITLNQIENAADMLGVSVEYLLSQPKEADTPVETPAVQQRLMKMETAFQKLNDEGQEKAIERLKELTEIPRYKRNK